MYDVKSLKAEEFISHQEILDTLAYAEENKENRELLDQILETNFDLLSNLFKNIEKPQENHDSTAARGHTAARRMYGGLRRTGRAKQRRPF